MGPKPRQIFVTKSRVLAAKVEESFETLMSSLEADGYSHEELRKKKEADREIEFVDQDDNEQWRSDLPEKFSELADGHFPLFITFDRVRMFIPSMHLTSSFHEQLCTMLQNDIERGNRNVGFIPEMDVFRDEATSPTSPTSPRKSRLRAGSEVTSSPNHRQQFHRNLVSYSVFLAFYWDHLPQTFTRVLGER